MSEKLPPNLERLGAQLDAAWQPATARRRPRLVLAGGVVVALVAAVVLALTFDLGGANDRGSGLGGVPSAQAAIARARAALTPPGSGVFHVRIESRELGQGLRVNEIWESRTSIRATNTGLPESGMRDDGTEELFDQARNIIYAAKTSQSGSLPSLFTEYTATARGLLASGSARVAGRATVDGIACIRIQDTSVRGVTNTLFVDARTYRPVVERIVGAHLRSEFTFRVWQVLAPTRAARRLADLRLMHPNARIVFGKTGLYAAKVRLLHMLPGPPGQPPRPRVPGSIVAGSPSKAECVGAFNAPANADWQRYARRARIDRAVVSNALATQTPGCTIKLWLPRDPGPWQHAIYVYGRWRNNTARYVATVRVHAVAMQHTARIRTPIRWANALVQAGGTISHLTLNPAGLSTSR